MVNETGHDPVVVVGGGPAGVAAAVACARAGVRTLLVEKEQRLGGTVSAAMHRCLVGLYASQPTGAADTLNQGIQRQVVERMILLQPGKVAPRPMGQTWVLEFPQSAWRIALEQMIQEAGVETQLDCCVTGATIAHRRIAGVALRSKGDPQTQTITPRAVIDCTGQGEVLQLLGDSAMQPREPGREMGWGYCLRLKTTEIDLEAWRLLIPYELAKAVQAGLLPAEARFAVFMPGEQAGEGILKLTLHPPDAPRNHPSRTVREYAARVLAHLQKEVPACRGMEVLEESPQPHSRLGRQLQGVYTLQAEDIRQSRPLPDHAHRVRAWWPMEYWDLREGPTYDYPVAGKAYDIPSSALKSLAVENLWAAGACLSATAEAAASARAGGICLATGALAGAAAADELFAKDR